jgi:glutamyl-tRNA reductase
VNENKAERDREAEKARKIIQTEVGSFNDWLNCLEMEPTIVAIRRKAEEIKKQELEKTLAKLDLDKNEKSAVEAMASSIINKMLHDPTLHLKEHARQNNETGEHKSSITEFVKGLFNLE